MKTLLPFKKLLAILLICVPLISGTTQAAQFCHTSLTSVQGKTMEFTFTRTAANTYQFVVYSEEGIINGISAGVYASNVNGANGQIGFGAGRTVVVSTDKTLMTVTLTSTTAPTPVYTPFYVVTTAGEQMFQAGIQNVAIDWDTPCAAPTDEVPPVMVDATLVSVTYNSALINVSATDDETNPVTRFVVSVNGGTQTTLTAVGGQITITGLEQLNWYIVEVWAKDAAGNVSENSVIVDNVITTEFQGACSGVRGHFSGEAGCNISYTISYYEGAVTYTVTSAEAGKTLNFLEIQTTAGNFAATITGGVGTYTQSGLSSGTMVGIRFLYGLTGLAGYRQTAADPVQTSNPNIILYQVGQCAYIPPPDETAPEMVDAVLIGSAGAHSATIDVLATDNVTDPVVKFMVSVNGGATQEYTAVYGQIVINGLAPSTAYVIEIWSKDEAGNISANSLFVQFATAAPTGVCSGNRGHFGTPESQKIHFEISYLNNVVTFKVNSLNAADPIDFFEVQSSLGNYAGTIADGIGTYNQSVTSAQIGTMLAVRFLYSLQSNEGNEMTAEFTTIADANIIPYVIGDCETIIPPDETAPVMVSAALVGEVGENSATISVSATDDVTNPVTIFIVSINGGAEQEYTAVNGQIVINGLNPETKYTIVIKAKDAAGNVSENSLEAVFTTATGAGIDNINANAIVVYVDNYELRIMNYELKESDNVRIFNITGQIMNAQKTNNSSFIIHNLNSGVYIVKIGKYTGKFIKR